VKEEEEATAGEDTEAEGTVKAEDEANADDDEVAGLTGGTTCGTVASTSAK